MMLGEIRLRESIEPVGVADQHAKPFTDDVVEST
jgi:hypothetical protein